MGHFNIADTALDQKIQKPHRCSAEHAEHNRFAQELACNVVFRGPNGHTHADFARPFSDGNQHDVHDSDAADDERTERDAGKQEFHHAKCLRARLRDIRRAADNKVIRFRGTKMMALAQQADAICACAASISADDSGGDVDALQPGDSRKLFHYCRIRQDHSIVLILPVR